MKKRLLKILVLGGLTLAVVATSSINSFAENQEYKRRELKYDQMINALEDEGVLVQSHLSDIDMSMWRPGVVIAKVIRDMSDCTIVPDQNGNKNVAYKYSDAYIASIISLVCRDIITPQDYSEAILRLRNNYRPYTDYLQYVFDEETDDVFEAYFIEASILYGDYREIVDIDMETFNRAKYLYQYMPYFRTLTEDFSNKEASEWGVDDDEWVVFDYERR